jgi:hypothetical protein
MNNKKPVTRHIRIYPEDMKALKRIKNEIKAIKNIEMTNAEIFNLVAIDFDLKSLLKRMEERNKLSVYQKW